MKLEQALQYLETTARVSCPQITCDQAREIAELMRDLSWKTYAQVLRERDEARAKLREVERKRDAEVDCGQEGECAKPPGCQKHWAFKASELVRERNEIHARFSLFDCEDGCGCGDRHCWRPGRADTRCITCKLIDSLEETEEVRQAACGFAWDAGREMAVAENTAAFWEAQHAAQKRYHRMVAADKAEEVDRLQEQAESLRRQLDAPVEAAPDFDADDYAKPGKR